MAGFKSWSYEFLHSDNLWQDSNHGLMNFYTPTTYETHFVSCSGEKGGIGAYKTHF
jgi:hypothetical protein